MNNKTSKVETAKFLDLKICSKIEVYDYLADFYKKPRFLRLPNAKFLEKVCLFFFRYLRKIILFCSLIFRLKLSFSSPGKFKNIIFDDENLNVTKILFLRKNYFVLKTRIEKIDKIFISKKIIGYVVKNFFKRSIKENYLSSLIMEIEPVNVVTLIENSVDFFIQAKIFKNSRIKFIVAQNAVTFDTSVEVKKKRFFSEYYAFSNYEKKIFNNKSVNKKIIPFGSIRALAAKQYLTKKPSLKKSYDICLISEPCFEPFLEDLIEDKIDQKVSLVAKYSLRFAKKYKKKIIVCGKHDIKSYEKYIEEKYYKHNLNLKKFKITFNDKLKFGSYRNILQSDIVIGSTSSLLREAFAFKKKVLWCNYMSASLFPFSHPIRLQKKDYLSFEKALLKLLKMKTSTYFNCIRQKEFIYYYKEDTFNKLKKQLS